MWITLTSEDIDKIVEAREKHPAAEYFELYTKEYGGIIIEVG